MERTAKRVKNIKMYWRKKADRKKIKISLFSSGLKKACGRKISAAFFVRSG
jgi:hypothetical protein